MVYRIRGHFGGLGDQIQFTALAQELHEAGHTVCLLSDPEHKQVKPYRNEQIKQFVWGDNPFVSQQSEGAWNAGGIPEIKYSNLCNDFLKNWALLHGIKKPKHSFPKIYRQPNLLPEISGVIELSSITLQYDHDKVLQTVAQIRAAFPAINFQQVVSPNQNNRFAVPNTHALQVTSLWELWDVLGSAKVFISLNSGSHSMAAAVKQFNLRVLIYNILPKNDAVWILEGKRFVFPGITYLTEGDGF